jgi:sensor c-di-GMP phosphodiesterase-like protein
MSKNIKIDAKHATVSEIDKAIDTLKDLRDEKCAKANQKELKDVAAKFDGQWIIEEKRVDSNNLTDSTSIIRIDKVLKISYELMKGLKVDASVIKIFKTMDDTHGFVYNTVAIDTKLTISFYDREVKVVNFKKAQETLEKARKNMNNQMDCFLIYTPDQG